MIDMATLALADGRASAPERVSMREVGRLLGLPDQDVDEIIASRTQS
jgi:tellurite resistance protein